MKIKTSELIGTALDWAVVWAERPSGPTGEGWYERDADGKLFDPLNECTVSASTIWEQGGPIIERECIALNGGQEPCASMQIEVADGDFIVDKWIEGRGPTPLIAAMRCYVASKLGDEVDVPEELV